LIKRGVRQLLQNLFSCSFSVWQFVHIFMRVTSCSYPCASVTWDLPVLKEYVSEKAERVSRMKMRREATGSSGLPA